MDELIRAALDNLNQSGWYLLWRDYKAFGLREFFFIESEVSSAFFPDDVARELLERGYVSQVDEDDARDWRRTYTITEAGRNALTA